MSWVMLLAAVAVISVVVLRRVAPIIASGLALILSVAAGALGVSFYQQGGGLKIGTLELSLPAFLVLIALLIGLESWNMKRNLAFRRQEREEAEAEAREEADEPAAEPPPAESAPRDS